MTYQFNEAQLKWLEALESGELDQAQHNLFDGKGYCCLGVLCKVLGAQFEKRGNRYQTDDGRSACLPDRLAEKAKMRNQHGYFYPANKKRKVGGVGFYGLTDANDNGATFPEIAAFIRSNPTTVFKE